MIVRHPEPLVLSQDNTRFWQPEAQRRPQAGESMYRRWDNEGDSAEEITEVPEDQPDAEHGFWTVESTGGGGIIHWTGHEWEEVE